MNPVNIDKYLVTAAIDFGTTYSGYAYSYHYVKDKIHVNSNWKCGSSMFKVPTAILFDNKENFISFGHEAEDDYTGYADSNEEKDYLFFYRFKMSLYKGTEVSRDIMLPAMNGKKMKAMNVFAGAIQYLKQHLIDSINQRNAANKVHVNNVQWVLTVPAIWSDAAKHFMREATTKAGIKSDNLVIALEPECASIYCQTLPVDQLPQQINMNAVGVRYMVVDIGGGTVDITFHERQPNGKLKELYKANGDDSGGTKVDQLFEDYLSNIFSKQVIHAVKDKHPSEWLEMLREFEATKRSLHDTDGLTLVKLKPSLHEMHEEIQSTTIANAFKRGSIYHEDVKLQGKNILKVPKTDFRELIVTVTNKISELVKSLLQKPEFKDIDFIILVGGFANSCFVMDKLKETAGNIPIIRPEEAELAVVRGAVLFGWKPDKLTSRKSRRTYGIAIWRNFREGIDPENLALFDSEGVRKCDNIFDCLIKINQTVEAGETISRVYFPLNANTKSSIIDLFATVKENVAYVTDPDVFKVGSVVLDMSDISGGKNREVKVNLHLGQTEFKLDVIDVTTGNNVTAIYDFLSQ